jgi:hypothetical protein
MNKCSFLFTILATLSLGACATTQSGAGKTDRFAAADANHDEKLSRAEAMDYFATEIFESRDLNHDGKLTWAEWNVPGAHHKKVDFDAADTNKDGMVDTAEAKAYARKRGLFATEFRKADTDRDGFVTRAEAKAFVADVEGPPR